MNIDKLMKKKAEIEAAIVQAEAVRKNQFRIEKLALRLLHKHPGIFLADHAQAEAELGQAFSQIEANLK